MVSGLQEVNLIFAHQVNDAVLLRQPAGPCPWSQVSKRLRFACPGKGISQNGVDQVKCSQGKFPVGLHPEMQVFNEFGVKDGQALFSIQGVPRAASHPR